MSRVFGSRRTRVPPVPAAASTARPAVLTFSLFRRNRSGATAVEFALVSVPFLGLLLAIFQTCLAFLMQQGLKAALDNAARQILTGQAQSNTAITSWQSFRDTLICPASPATSLLPSFITCSSILVDVRPYSTFTGLTQANVSKSFLTDGTGPRYDPGDPCEIVIVRAAYPMPVFLPNLMDTTLGKTVTQNTTGLTSYGGKWVQMLSAAAVFRNEPYIISGSSSLSSGCS